MTLRCAIWILAAAVATPVPAHAREAQVETRAGTAAQAVITLARQTGTSIVIADQHVARRAVPPMTGSMPAEQAIHRLARAAGGRAIAVGPSAWRIDAAPRRMARVPPVPPLVTATRQSAPEPPAPAQPITVFASKRGLRLDQIAGQVSIIEGQTLDMGGVGGTEKITRELATVTSTHLGSGRNKLFIRGIADSSFTGPTQATVGQYLGDLRLTYNAPDPDLRLSDMERVEVLEGPQGTLYGAGSLGGIIRLVPHVPELDTTSFTGQVGGSITQGGAAGGDVDGTVNLPLISGLAAVRATFDATTLGGYIDKPALQRRNTNRSRIVGGRVAVRLTPAPNWTVDLMALGQSTHLDDSQYAMRGSGSLINTARVPEPARSRYELGQLVVSGRLGALHLRSTTGIIRQHLTENYDANQTSDPPRLFTQTNRSRMIAHETRIWMPERDGFSWLLGASYIHARTVLTRDFAVLSLLSATTGVENTIDEATLYGEGSIHLTDAIVATAGGRFTHSVLNGAGEDVLPMIALARADVTARRTQTTFLPSLALQTNVAPGTSLYMRYQQGFRPGGLAIENDFVRRFRSDRTRTYEWGARHGRPGTGRYDLALSISYTLWRNIQADFIDSSGLPSTANIGNGRVWSASVSGGMQIGPELRLEAALTWNQSRVDRPSPAQFALLARSRQVPNIANVATRAALAWRHPMTDRLSLSARAWAGYIGPSRLGVGPELGASQGDYLDSGADLRLGLKRLGVTVSVTNLANVRGNRFSLGTPFDTGRDQITPLRPRTLRLGIDTTF